MNFVKLSLSLLLSASIANAGAKNLDNNDSFEMADSNSSLKSSKRDGYMPAIITPDEFKSGLYGGLALSTGYVDSDVLGSNGMLDLSLIAGYNINEYIAAESRATISMAYGNGVDYKNLSLFLKPKYEAYEGLNIYSLIGIGKSKVDSINSDDLKSNNTSFQYGIGADYKLKNNFKVFADYTYLGKDKNAKYKNGTTALKSGSFTTGIGYDF